MNDPKEIKKIFDKVILTNTEITTKSDSTLSRKRNQFLKTIQLLEGLYARSDGLMIKFGLNFSEYDAPMFELIDNLLTTAYGKTGKDIIHFYMFERRNPDGSMNHLVDSAKNPIFLNNEEDLWNLIYFMNKKQTKKK